MKVLITGGYGFIGSHVVEQFYKEGYEVHIIDNLSTGKKENISCPHKAYILSIEDSKCKDIFTTHKFDIVVHLAAQVSVAKSVASPMEDAQLNILGLINILQLSKQHNVKKFIFASTAAVYGNNTNLPLNEYEIPAPISPYGISKWCGEKYCLATGTSNEMETLCFRFSNVYGPRQTTEGEGGVVSIFTNRLLENAPLIIHGDGNQTRDFIYVGDVAYAIYRASQSLISGVYNLSTNTEGSILEIVETLENIHGPIEKQFITARDGDIYRSSLSNSNVKKDLDWSPFYTLEEGLEKTYTWAKNNLHIQDSKMEKQKQLKVLKPLPKTVQTVKPYIENFLIFTILSTILLTVQIPVISTFIFGVFYIMIIGSIYGNRQGFVGVVLSFCLLVTESLLNGREIISLLYDTTFLFQISTFLFVGLVVGYSVQRKNTIIAEQKEEIAESQKRYAFLEELHTEIRDIKDELQLRVKINEDSFGKIYSIIKELDDLEPEKIFTNTVTVVERIMRCQEVSIYVFNKHHSFLRLVATSEVMDSSYNKNSLKVDETPFVQQIMNTGKPFVNRQLQPEAPLLAAPIYYNNEIRAIITINQLSFEQLSNYHENLFVVVKELIQSSLWRAMEFIKFTEDLRYIDNTEVLQFDKFNEILQTKEQAKQDYKMPYVLLSFPTLFEQLQTSSHEISKLLRETDYLGFKDDQLYILLSNTTEADLPFILKRIREAGYYIEQNQKVVL